MFTMINGHGDGHATLKMNQDLLQFKTGSSLAWSIQQDVGQGLHRRLKHSLAATAVH